MATSARSTPLPSAAPPPEKRAEGARKEVLRGALLVAFVRGSGALLGLAFWVLLARRLGASGCGQLRQGMALVMFSAAFLRLGLGNIVMREVAILTHGGHAASRDARVLMQRVFLLIVAVGIPLAGILWLSADWLSIHWFEDPELQTVLAISAWACIPMAIIVVSGEAHKGAGRGGWGTFLQFDARHLVFLLAAVVWLKKPGTGDVSVAEATETAAWILLASLCFAAVLSLFGWMSRGPRAVTFDAETELGRRAIGLREALRQGVPLLQCAMLLMSLQWLDTLFLGSFADSHAVGVYGAAVSGAMLMSFLLYGANMILAPRFARAFEAGDSVRVEREARAATRMLLLAGVPAAILIIVFAEPFLGLFGPEFASGGTQAFRILILGQLVCLGTGPVGYILLMGKREKPYRNNTAIAAVTHLVLLLVLLPPYGIVGASLATSVALAVSNLLHLRSCRRDLGLATIGPRVTTDLPGSSGGSGEGA